MSKYGTSKNKEESKIMYGKCAKNRMNYICREQETYRDSGPPGEGAKEGAMGDQQWKN